MKVSYVSEMRNLDGKAMDDFGIAAKAEIKTEVEVFPFNELPEVLILAKGGR